MPLWKRSSFPASLWRNRQLRLKRKDTLMSSAKIDIPLGDIHTGFNKKKRCFFRSFLVVLIYIVTKFNPAFAGVKQK